MVADQCMSDDIKTVVCCWTSDDGKFYFMLF